MANLKPENTRGIEETWKKQTPKELPGRPNLNRALLRTEDCEKTECRRGVEKHRFCTSSSSILINSKRYALQLNIFPDLVGHFNGVVAPFVEMFFDSVLSISSIRNKLGSHQTLFFYPCQFLFSIFFNI